VDSCHYLAEQNGSTRSVEPLTVRFRHVQISFRIFLDSCGDVASCAKAWLSQLGYSPQAAEEPAGSARACSWLQSQLGQAT
jgi:hypothetical protein